MLVVEFESEQYNGSESSGFVEVTVMLNGSSTTSISVMLTITTAGLSARSKRYNSHTIHCISICYMELGNDLDTEPIALTFAPNEVNKTANVPLKCDRRLEDEERFNISLTLTSNNPQVRTGRDRSVGIIRDSTGNDGTVVSIGDDM